MKPAELKKQVLMAVEAAHAKQAQNVAILELPAESSAFTDYFVVCSGSNPRQVQAICDEVEESLSKAGMEPNHREGYDQAEWVLLDYVDFVLHVFSENARKFYDLERLWKSATHLTESDLKTARKSPAKKAAPATAKKAVAAKKSIGRIAAPGKPAAKKTLARKSAARKPVKASSTRTRTKKK